MVNYLITLVIALYLTGCSSKNTIAIKRTELPTYSIERPYLSSLVLLDCLSNQISQYPPRGLEVYVKPPAPDTVPKSLSLPMFQSLIANAVSRISPIKIFSPVTASFDLSNKIVLNGTVNSLRKTNQVKTEGELPVLGGQINIEAFELSYTVKASFNNLIVASATDVIRMYIGTNGIAAFKMLNQNNDLIRSNTRVQNSTQVDDAITDLVNMLTYRVLSTALSIPFSCDQLISSTLRPVDVAPLQQQQYSIVDVLFNKKKAPKYREEGLCFNVIPATSTQRQISVSIRQYRRPDIRVTNHITSNIQPHTSVCLEPQHINQSTEFIDILIKPESSNEKRNKNSISAKRFVIGK